MAVQLPFFSRKFSQRHSPYRTRFLRKLLAIGLIICALGFAAFDHYRPQHGTVRIITAASNLNSGTKVSATDLSIQHIPKNLAPDASIADTDLIEGKTLAGPMTAGEIFTQNRFVSPALADALVGEPHSKIVAIKPADAGIISVLQVGDVVDVIAARNGENNAAPIATGAKVAATGDEENVFLALPAGAAEIVASINIDTPITLVLSY